MEDVTSCKHIHENVQLRIFEGQYKQTQKQLLCIYLQLQQSQTKYFYLGLGCLRPFPLGRTQCFSLVLCGLPSECSNPNRLAARLLTSEPSNVQPTH